VSESQTRCSGEALPWTARALFQRLDAELHNLYGPKAAIDVTFGTVSQTASANLFPLRTANTQIYLLIGICNLSWLEFQQLHIGGVGLARGYLNRPDLTNEKFIPNFWGGKTTPKQEI